VVHDVALGTGQLCELIDGYGDEITADFRQFYSGLDLADVWRGKLSPATALVLVEQLKTIPMSRFRAQVMGGFEHLGWTPDTYLAAALYDAMNTNSVITAKSAGGKARDPEPYPRPDQAAKSIQVDDIDDFPVDAMQHIIK
jgi:hypothetical protein